MSTRVARAIVNRPPFTDLIGSKLYETWDAVPVRILRLLKWVPANDAEADALEHAPPTQCGFSAYGAEWLIECTNGRLVVGYMGLFMDGRAVNTGIGAMYHNQRLGLSAHPSFVRVLGVNVHYYDLPGRMRNLDKADDHNCNVSISDARDLSNPRLLHIRLPKEVLVRLMAAYAATKFVVLARRVKERMWAPGGCGMCRCAKRFRSLVETQ